MPREAVNARVDMRTVRKPKKHGRVHTAFTKPHAQLFGKPAKPSPCPGSYWADPLPQAEPWVFYALVRERAEQTKGRERVTT